MQTATVSIIVPVYNARAFVQQCIESVLAQSFLDLELILIDDGSTDDSLMLCRSRESDPRVRIISTENRGVSAARNLGLQKASGRWIMFLDSDDCLTGGCLERLMAMIQPDTQQIVAAYSGDGSAEVFAQSVSADALRTMTLDPINHRLLPEFYEVKPLSLSSCCAKLYRRDVIRNNGIAFREELRLSEDTLFNLDYLACIDHGTVTNLSVFDYRENTASVTRTFRPAHLSNRLRFFRILKERYGPDAAVHILSLLFCEISKIERAAGGQERKQLEQEIRRYLSENPDILHHVHNRSLSKGKWQKAVYQAAAVCFRHRAYGAGFVLFRTYAAASSGKTNK